MFGEPQSRQDVEFDAVIAAVARRNKRENVAHRKEEAYVSPLHKKAVIRRRKRKRGGPK